MTATLRSALSRHLDVQRAHAAARAGDPVTAARLLDDLDAAGAATPAALDLRARLHAQQGELAEADACWARVQETEPDDRDARAGRETLARIRAGGRARPLLGPGRLALCAAVLVVALVAGVAAVATSGPAAGPAAAPPATTPEPAVSQTASAEVERLRQAVASAQAAQASAATRRTQALDTVAARLDVAGVRVERRAEDVRVVFEAGLFRTGSELAPGSRRVLAAVGRRLARVSGTTTVVGHTVAVPGGRTSGGSATAYARAQVAAQQLAGSSGLPLTAFTLATADQSQGPFPDAARNRTVTLVVRPV